MALHTSVPILTWQASFINQPDLLLQSLSYTEETDLGGYALYHFSRILERPIDTYQEHKL